MSLKQKIKKIKTLEDCESLMRSEMVTYKSVFQKVYTTYADQWSQQIKIYEKENEPYVTIVREFDGIKLKAINVYLTKKKPSTPHPLFPIPHSYLVDPEKYEFSSEVNV